MDPLTRWHIDPKSSTIESESQKILSHMPTSALSTAGSMANFVDLMHKHITHLYELPGDTLYSRYTIAFKIIQTAVRWKFTGTGFERNSVRTSSISPAEIRRLFRPLDTQFKSILKEGLMRKGGLPWDQALCFLETHGVERLYAASWEWLRELFHYEDVSQKYVPLTIIKGAGNEYIPIPEGESAIVADFHSIRTQTTDSPTYLTSGFYRIKAGPTRNIPTYDYEETKYVLNGQIDVLDEATGVTHHLVAGDFAFFHVGSKAQFSSKSGGTAFFAVTRPIITQHPGLKGREEKVLSKL
ncbi:hypothetical protein J4E85_004909 [Alternaria conjuncta]|uniref:uncharacterized protein n=1 Tax=Alternaria conjuncta TaxID=181017 RepID=UPI00221EE830|nr:uncharacterized protein J4E85_004909 [Alternaria conjuncta]KAI4930283.1 hypothetical protein J4E85_004909 [Alternaria conjuncta]